MDIPTALHRNKNKRISSGNLDPVNVFLADEKEIVFEKTIDLFNATKNDSNFLITPGCDLPVETPLENAVMFYSIIRSWQGA